ncbi:MAG: amidohydrolase family protein [Deltaproteobacteria bacterium]|nr:amidohydrolase family protein [Deltaproteobacteria bacterium]
MIIDFHTHLFPESIIAGRECYWASEPAFELLYRSPKSRLVSAPELLAAMDLDGVDTSVVFGFPWQDPELFKMHNDRIMEVVQRHPGRLIGFGCFDPASSEAPREAERCLAGGLAGIGELAFYRCGIDGDALDRLAPVMDICRERGRPVLIHTNEPVGHDYPGKTPNTLAEIYRMVERFPANTIVLAHWGGGLFFFNLLKKEVKDRLKNIYFDTAASPYLYDPGVYSLAVQTIGAEKVLFGSDFPLLPPSRYFREMEAAQISSKDQDMICGLNAARLLNL